MSLSRTVERIILLNDLVSTPASLWDKSVARRTMHEGPIHGLEPVLRGTLCCIDNINGQMKLGKCLQSRQKHTGRTVLGLCLPAVATPNSWQSSRGERLDGTLSNYIHLLQNTIIPLSFDDGPNTTLRSLGTHIIFEENTVLIKSCFTNMKVEKTETPSHGVAEHDWPTVGLFKGFSCATKNWSVT